jgi:PadR family transcriptional regulator PadR
MTVEGIKNVDNVKAQMRKGILEYCILSILSRGDSYAPQIISELKQADMIVVEGTLYPLLARQKNQGLLSYRWEESPQGPPRKYYMITERGHEVLQELDVVWEEVVAQIRTIRYGTGMDAGRGGGIGDAGSVGGGKNIDGTPEGHRGAEIEVGKGPDKL